MIKRTIRKYSPQIRFLCDKICPKYTSHFRYWSREIIEKYATEGVGLEIGTEIRTIAPRNRTVLSSAYQKNHYGKSIAREFFPGDQIPYREESFNFILSEHVLEHVRDPIGMLKEWMRVLKPEGHVFLFLPNPAVTFDRFRKRTTLQHLIQDHEGQDSDQAHLADWFKNVLDHGLARQYQYKYSQEEVLEFGLLHRHVWQADDIHDLVRFLKMKVIFTQYIVPDRQDSFLVVAQK